jgi:hypothetical protein
MRFAPERDPDLAHHFRLRREIAARELNGGQRLYVCAEVRAAAFCPLQYPPQQVLGFQPQHALDGVALVLFLAALLQGRPWRA